MDPVLRELIRKINNIKELAEIKECASQRRDDVIEIEEIKIRQLGFQDVKYYSNAIHAVYETGLKHLPRIFTVQYIDETEFQNINIATKDGIIKYVNNYHAVIELVKNDLVAIDKCIDEMQSHIKHPFLKVHFIKGRYELRCTYEISPNVVLLTTVVLNNIDKQLLPIYFNKKDVHLINMVKSPWEDGEFKFSKDIAAPGTRLGIILFGSGLLMDFKTEKMCLTVKMYDRKTAHEEVKYIGSRGHKGGEVFELPYRADFVDRVKRAVKRAYN